MKRFLVLALTFALIFSLCACSASDNDESGANFAGAVSKPTEEPNNDSSSVEAPSEGEAVFPDLVGEVLDEALLAKLFEGKEYGVKIDFSFDAIVPVIDNDKPEGTIISTEPKAGDIGKKDADGKLYFTEVRVSKKDKSGFPDFVGSDVDVARYMMVLQNIPTDKLTIVEVTEAEGDYEDGDIIETSPKAGEEYSADDKIIFYVYKPAPKPELIANFISIGTIDTKVNASSVKSIPLTGVNTELAEGAIVVYYGEGCNKIGNTSDFAVAVFDYSDVYFGYTLKNLYEFYNGEEAVIELPQDGFVLAVHSSFETHIRKLKNIKENETVFPHGLHIYNGADYTVKKADTAPEIDGVFDADQWQEFYIEDVNASNPSWSYEQFQVNKYYSNAAYYTAYDDEYIYLAVVVDSPYHYCPVTMENPNAMYQYECIQVKVSSEDPSGEYIATNFDHVANSKAVTDGVVRSYGFACNDNGDTVYYENGITKNFTGLAGCSRDDATQTTVYEVAIPFAEFNLTPASGMKLGLTFSINSTNEEDVAAGVWKNVTYRNGGGVIGRNDWTKIPVITLE